MDKNTYKLNKHIFDSAPDKDGEIFTILCPMQEKTDYLYMHIPEQPKAKKEAPRKVQDKSKSKVLGKTFEFTKQLTFSMVIFGAIFLLLNFPAYATIFKAKIDKFRGITQANVLQEFVEPKQSVEQKMLPIKAVAPAISMKIAPPDTRLIIPRINKNIPVIQVSDEQLIRRDFNALEKDIQKGLENGIINYPGTSKPGEHGNVVITGHSSYFPWSAGSFKDVFAILTEVKEGDKIVLFHDQKKYIYTVFKTEVVSPKNIESLKQTTDDILTLITCVPVGTDLSRLIVRAKLDSIES